MKPSEVLLTIIMAIWSFSAAKDSEESIYSTSCSIKPEETNNIP